MDSSKVVVSAVRDLPEGDLGVPVRKISWAPYATSCISPAICIEYIIDKENKFRKS
jgi:hypothetical protein